MILQDVFLLNFFCHFLTQPAHRRGHYPISKNVIQNEALISFLFASNVCRLMIFFASILHIHKKKLNCVLAYTLLGHTFRILHTGLHR